ncbi:MAG: hypothetical protein ACKO96_02715, partial [Flammeovirgaceae bacterium]
PSGGWVPACIAGNTGIGLSQRMQSFVLDAKENPFNVVEPGKRPRVTLTPTLALKDGLIYRHTDTFDFWRWSRMALGTPGKLLGWSTFLQNKVKATAMGSLKKFIETRKEYHK